MEKKEERWMAWFLKDWLSQGIKPLGLEMGNSSRRRSEVREKGRLKGGRVNKTL